MQGRDMIGRARTGTGKTLAFGIPIMDKIIQFNAKHGFFSLIHFFPCWLSDGIRTVSLKYMFLYMFHHTGGAGIRWRWFWPQQGSSPARLRRNSLRPRQDWIQFASMAVRPSQAK